MIKIIAIGADAPPIKKEIKLTISKRQTEKSVLNKPIKSNEHPIVQQ
jgi:uncharacterized protein YaiI (UPF0178 family)